MSDFERGSWATIAAVTAFFALLLALTGSDDWMDGITTAGLAAYLSIVGKRTQQEDQ